MTIKKARDDKYVAELLAHLRTGGPFVVSNPENDVIPLLEELQERRAAAKRTDVIVDKALEVARVWRGQDGINAALLDQLAVEVLGV